MSIAFRTVFELAGEEMSGKLNLWIGAGLVQLVTNNDVLSRIHQLRQELRRSGYEMPVVHVRDRVQLSANGYEIEVDSTVVAAGESTAFDEVLDDLRELTRTHAVLFDCMQ